jgi:carbamoyltransferase
MSALRPHSVSRAGEGNAMNVLGISGLHNSVPFKKRELPNLSPRYYRIAQGADSAAALVTNDGIRAAAAEERFTGEKQTGSFPANAIRYCVHSATITPESIDYLAHSFSYEEDRSHYEYTEFARKQFAEVYSREAQIRCIEEHFPSNNWAHKFVQVPHHLAHAASAFYVSGFDESLILVVDGMGERHCTTVAVGRKNNIEIIKQIPALHSLGILYGLFTLYLGFHMGSDEYKVMGLASYGDPRRYFGRIMELIHLKTDGTYTTPILFKNSSIEEKETYQGSLRVLAEVFGPARESCGEITQHHMDIAAALQAGLQACLMHVLRHFRRETGQSNLCMAGGVALNCTANGVISRSRMFKDIFIQPAAGDDGSALGAALYVHHLHEPNLQFKRMGLPLWGPRYKTETIQRALGSQTQLKSILFHSFKDLARDIAKRIARGEVVAWFQGRMEFGPRALGNRSILADPRDPGMRDHLNRLIKKRESFRPFAPAVIAEAAAQFFEIERQKESLYAYMLFTTQVRAPYREQLPAITHVDGSARVQVVPKADNPRFWSLIDEFGKVSGIPVVLNTSLNLREQPIVCTPNEAIETFLSSEIDVLVIEDCVIERRTSGHKETCVQVETML